MRKLATAVLLVLAGVIAPAAHAAYPGYNGKIAFASARDDPNSSGCGFFDCRFEIYSMNADGSGVTRLTSDLGRDLDPAWSPDGTKIAFTHRTSGIWVMNADGSGAHQVSCCGDSPSWSPDGTEIAFHVSESIAAVTAGGGDLPLGAFGTCEDRTDPTAPCYSYEAPAWSPSGDLIATQRRDFLGEAGGYDFHVALVRAGGVFGGGQVSQFSRYSFSPDWSPSAAQLAFTAFSSTSAEIWKSNPDGSMPTQLTDTPAAEHFAAWSPDGRQIAFARAPGDLGAYEIWTASSSGGSEQQLTSSPGADIMPDWQPLAGPQRSDYKNAAQFCNAERAFLGDTAFGEKHGGAEGAHGRCVNENK